MPGIVREIIVKVKSALDPAGFKDLKAETASIKDELGATGAGFNEINEASARASDEFETLGEKAKQSGNLVTRFGKSLIDAFKGALRPAEELAGDMDDVKKKTEEAEKETRKYEERLKGVREQAEVYGDVSSRLSSLAGLAGGLGAGGVSQAVMIGADVSDAVEAVRLAGPALEELGERAGKATPLLGTLGAKVGGLLGLSPGIATLGIAAGAAGAGLLVLAESLKGADQETLDWIEAIKLASKELGDMTTEGLEEKTADIQDQIDEQVLAAQGFLEKMGATPDEIARYAELIRQGGLLTLKTGQDEIDRAAEAFGLEMMEGVEINDDVVDFYNDVIAAEEEIQKLRKQQEAFTTGVAQQTIAANDAAEAMRRQAEADVAALKQTAEAQAQVIEFAERYTQEQLDAEIARNQQQQAMAQGDIDRLNEWIGALEAKGDLTEGEIARLEVLTQAREDSLAALEDLAGQETALELAAPLIADREAEAASIAALDAEYQRELQSRQMLRDASAMTVDQIEDRLAAIDDERAAIMAILPELEDLAATNDQAAQKVKVFKDQLSDLDFEADTLRALEPAALAAQMKEAWGEGVKAFGEYQDELVRLEEKAAEDRLDVAEAVAEQDVKIREKAAGDLAKLEKEIAADRLEAVEDAAGEERKIRRRQDLEDRFELKRHLKDLSGLALARNVDAYIAAQEDQALDLEQERAERDLEALERQEALDEELAQIKANADAKTEAIHEQGAKELATLQENEARQLAQIDERLEQEYTAREEAFTKQLDALAGSLDRQEDEAVKGYGALEDEFASYLAEMGGDLAAFGLDAKSALAGLSSNLLSGLSGGSLSGAVQALEGRVSTRGSDLAGTTIQFNNTIENPTFGQLETFATANQRLAAFQAQQTYLWDRNARMLKSLLVK